LSDDGIRVVLMTVPDVETGLRIGRRLVEERLTACANVLPGLHSVYRWKDEVEEAGEALVVLKTVAGRVEALTERAAALHPYDVPEVLALPVLEGLQPYMDWVREGSMIERSGT
jgi:periplasmic divalent cation tolerance protein